MILMNLLLLVIIIHYNIALQCIRHGVGLRATAAITTAAVLDTGLITEGDRRLLVNHNNVKKAQEKVMK